jgi:hypothetical protein
MTCRECSWSVADRLLIRKNGRRFFKNISLPFSLADAVPLSSQTVHKMLLSSCTYDEYLTHRIGLEEAPAMYRTFCDKTRFVHQSRGEFRADGLRWRGFAIGR